LFRGRLLKEAYPETEVMYTLDYLGIVIEILSDRDREEYLDDPLLIY